MTGAFVTLPSMTLALGRRLHSAASSLPMLALTAAAIVSTTTISDDGLGLSRAHAQSQSVIQVSQAGAGVSQRVQLGLNKAVVIDLPTAAGDILVADPAVADAVTRTSQRIYLFGKTVGQTNIFIFGPNGEEIVTLDLQIERDITGLEAQLDRFIEDSDITVEIINDNIVLTGTVQTPQDSAQAVQLANIFLRGGEATTREIVAQGGENSGDSAIFAEERQRSQIVNLLTIEGDDQVTLMVTVADVSREVLKQLGFNSTVRGDGGSLIGTIGSNFGSNLEQPPTGGASAVAQAALGNYGIEARLNALERSGVMRTLAEPSLTAISGEAASFFVGGDFRLVSEIDSDEEEGITYNVEEVEYGIGLDFTPVVLSAGRISLRVRTEVSEPTFQGSIGTSAGTLMSIARREAETSVELPSGGSIVIAGLVKDNIRQAMSGYPGASKIPVLGTLFRSRDFVRSETELVIIATPYLVRPVARNELARPDDNFNAASDGAGFFLGKVNRVYGSMDTDLPKGRYHGVVGFIYK